MDVPNLRDIGGIVVGDGRRIKTGFLLRSAALADATPEGLDKLRREGLAHVVDLRTQQEVTAQPDPAMDGVLEHRMDVFGATTAVGVADLSTDLGDADAATQAMIQAYRNMVSLPSAHRAYRDMLYLALQNQPFLFHCTEGKDRTGWAAALLLHLLLASDHQIEADYLLSNTGLIEQNTRMKSRMRAADPDIGDAVMDAYLSVKPAFLRAAFDEAHTRFGSIETYVRQALGFDDKAIARLREIYLVG